MFCNCNNNTWDSGFGISDNFGNNSANFGNGGNFGNSLGTGAFTGYIPVTVSYNVSQRGGFIRSTNNSNNHCRCCCRCCNN